jgi:hypothetical protein
MIENGRVRFGNAVIKYSIVRSRRRKKTIEITLDPKEGVLVAAPADTPPKKIEDVVRRRAAWIVRSSTERVLRARRKEFVSGESLPYLGRQVRLFVDSSNVRRVQVRFDHWSFRITVPSTLTGEARRAAIESAITSWYTNRARDRLRDRVERWAAILGQSGPRVLTRNQRQRWGSCSPDGTLRFNWRIVMAEPALIDYVVAHEMLHLRIRDHSTLFWTEMARAMPDYRLRRAKLKEIGASLSM